MKKLLWLAPLVAAVLALTYQTSGAGDKEKIIEKEVTTKAGKKVTLKYVELVEGKGKEAKKGDTVEVHYVGTFTDGKKFDSSRDRNKTFPVTIGETKVIQGWHEGLVGMKEGGKRKLILVPELAYGEEGYPGAIPPNATLIFEIELIKLK
jgi:peptidylprolyl isomerase